MRNARWMGLSTGGSSRRSDIRPCITDEGGAGDLMRRRASFRAGKGAGAMRATDEGRFFLASWSDLR
jgi:hypothetical protein